LESRDNSQNLCAPAIGSLPKQQQPAAQTPALGLCQDFDKFAAKLFQSWLQYQTICIIFAN